MRKAVAISLGATNGLVHERDKDVMRVLCTSQRSHFTTTTIVLIAVPIAAPQAANSTMRQEAL